MFGFDVKTITEYARLSAKVAQLESENAQLRASRDEHKRARYAQAYGLPKLWVGSGQWYVHQTPLSDPTNSLPDPNQAFINAYNQKIRNEKYSQRTTTVNKKEQLQSTISQLSASLADAQKRLDELNKPEPQLIDAVSFPSLPREAGGSPPSAFVKNAHPLWLRRPDAVRGTFVPDTIASRATLEALPLLLEVAKNVSRSEGGYFNQPTIRELRKLFP